MNISSLKQIIVKLIIGSLITVIFILGYMFTDIGNIIEMSLYDTKFEMRGKREASKDIVIVAIDSLSMEEVATWPWPRDIYADLIKKLQSYGAKVIAFDIIFNKPSLDSNQDKVFANSIKDFKNVVLGSMFVGGIYSKVTSSSENVETALSYTAPDIIESLLDGNLNYGVVNFDRDLDKNIRWGRLLHPLSDLTPSTQSINNEFEPHFTLQILKKYNPQLAETVQEKYKDNRFLINFAGSPHTYKTISFTNVLNDILLETNVKSYKDVFKDKIVLVGATAEILHDNFSTPFTHGVNQDLMPGVEVHAATIDTVMNGIDYRKADFSTDLAMILIMGLAATVVFALFSLVQGISFLFISSAIYSGLNILLFIKSMYWLNWSSPILIMICVFGGIYSYRFFVEEKEKRRVRGVFKRYMSPALVEEALKNPEKVPSLDVCSKKFVSVLFSDIAGFTTMSEKFPPEEVKRILDEYLTAMTEIVFANTGVLDKYVGDAVMAVYGSVGNKTPDDDAFRAVKTAIEMQEKIQELRKKWVEEGSVPMQIRIGVHSGEALIGNFGSPLKMDYTAIGDTVNTASRLEGLNKQFGSGIMISHSTYELISEKINVRNLGPAPVKGKSEAIHVYEVLGLANKETGPLIESKVIGKETKWVKGSERKTKWARGTKSTNWN